MIHSMTGFGRSQTSFGDKVITVDSRSLNSKYLDVNLRLPHLYREKEVAIRKYLSETLIRGKIDLTVHVQDQATSSYSINQNVINAYYRDIQKLPEELRPDSKELLPALLNLPETVSEAQEDLSKKEWQTLWDAIQNSVLALQRYRTDEGKEMNRDFVARIDQIKNGLAAIREADPARKQNKREKLQQLIDEHLTSEKTDESRLEQEVLFYLEKLDINEEIVRLASHCSYFREVLEAEEREKGKKLNFISQEMGREINTIGSKANDATFQKHVVTMKEELEKIKEQTNNIV